MSAPRSGIPGAHPEVAPVEAAGPTARPGPGASGRPRVVVVGGGFGGLQAAKALRDLPVDLTVIDRRNFHLFQPLVYQVATGSLSPAEVAVPLRWVFRRATNVQVLLGDVADVDLDRREVVLRPHDGAAPAPVPYDTLIVAGGSSYSYFGHEEWRAFAPDVKSLENALDVRARILAAFEAAELEPRPDRRAAWLTFVVVGAGPTGAEMAGQIAELAREGLRKDFRTVDPGEARILLLEMSDRILGTFPPSLSRKASRALEDLGVSPRVGHRVVDIDEDGVTVEVAGEEVSRIPARTVVWAAGVEASPLAAALARASGAELDRSGRVTVDPDLTLPGRPEVFALGDMVRVATPGGDAVALPGLAPVAMQEGRYAARVVRDRLAGRPTPPFHYIDKGNLATLGRVRAIADIHGLHLSGSIAWLTWLVVHLFYLVGFQNRLLVVIRWTISFVTRGRGARLITHESAAPVPQREVAG